MLRMLRVLRLMKLVRLIRSTRLYERYRSKVKLSYSAQTVIKCVFITAFGAHWYACIIALQASLHASIDQTWMGDQLYGLCGESDLHQNQRRIERFGANQTSLAVSMSVAPLPSCSSLGIGEWYVAALSWSVLVITGCGGTDYYPSRASMSETIVVTFLVVVGAFLWTIVLALFVDMVTNSDPVLTQFKQHLDGLNTYIEINDLPQEMAQRLRSFMHQQKDALVRDDAMRALPLLSTPLQIEVMLHVHRHWLEEVWFIRNLDDAVKVRLAMAMKPKVLAPGEAAPQRVLYIISRGLVFYNARILSRRMWWGDDVILSNPMCFLLCSARALAFSDVTYLTQQTLMAVVSSYPASWRMLRKATVTLAMRRGVVAFAKQQRAMAARGDGTSERLVQGRKACGVMFSDFLADRVQDVVAGTQTQEQEKSMAIALSLTEQDRTEAKETPPTHPVEQLQASLAELHSHVRAIHEEMRQLRSEVKVNKHRNPWSRINIAL